MQTRIKGHLESQDPRLNPVQATPPYLLPGSLLLGSFPGTGFLISPEAPVLQLIIN